MGGMSIATAGPVTGSTSENYALALHAGLGRQDLDPNASSARNAGEDTATQASPEAADLDEGFSPGDEFA